MFGKYNGFVSKARVSACIYFLVYTVNFKELNQLVQKYYPRANGAERRSGSFAVPGVSPFREFRRSGSFAVPGVPPAIYTRGKGSISHV
jgi:hypothetical protein